MIFSPTTMPEPGRPFHVTWRTRTGGKELYTGHLQDWHKYLALYGPPGEHAQWEYCTPRCVSFKEHVDDQDR